MCCDRFDRNSQYRQYRTCNTHGTELIHNSLMVDPIKGCAEINLNDPSLLSTLQCTLPCMRHAQKCITSTQTFPISKLGGRTHTIAFNRTSKRNRQKALKNLWQYWCYRNRLVVCNRGGLWSIWNRGDIDLSSASRESTQTNNLQKHYTKTGGQNISSSLKKKRKHT